MLELHDSLNEALSDQQKIDLQWMQLAYKQAAEAAAKAALWAFIASLLGAIAAAIGGRTAIRTVDATRVTTTRTH